MLIVFQKQSIPEAEKGCCLPAIVLLVSFVGIYPHHHHLSGVSVHKNLVPSCLGKKTPVINNPSSWTHERYSTLTEHASIDHSDNRYDIYTYLLLSCCQVTHPDYSFANYRPPTPMYALQIGSALFAFAIFYFINNVLALSPSSLYSYAIFLWSTFLKRHKSGGDQQSVLESQYKDQANSYDESRNAILPARNSLLCLAAAQLKERTRQGRLKEKPIWIEVSTRYIKLPDGCTSQGP